MAAPLDQVAPVLEVRNLVKSRAGRVVLSGVEVSLVPGRICVLLGPNGAGKTTLLGIACGRLAPDAGSVRLFGADPRRVADVRRRLGFVPQHLALYPYLSVRENLRVFGRMMGVARRDLADRVGRALALSGLVERAGERAETLSGGMGRRLNLAASLLHEPELLLLDEPTAGVDLSARERIHELLRQLRAGGVAVLIATHDLEQAEAIADEVIILADGRVRVAGAPEALREAVFGTGRELVVTLAEDPSPGHAAALGAHGLKTSAGALTWRGSFDGGYADAAGWLAELRAAGLAVAEFRVREPSLAGVFASVTGRELAP